MKDKLQMKKSLVRLGHCKWKSALGHTLLIIGMVLFAMGGYVQEATGGLYMHKTWVPDYTNCPDGSCGHIRLETFVTGESMTVDVHIPTDIVVVVDQSGSMVDDFDGNETSVDANRKVTALKDALNVFLQSVQSNAASTNCDHKVAIVGFAMGPNGGGTYPGNVQVSGYYNTELLTPSEIGYQSITTQNYKDALLLANVNDAVNPQLTSAVQSIDARGATYMQYGLQMAYNILNERDQKVFVDPNGVQHDRAQVVVFFTDGYPGKTYYDTGQLFMEGYYYGTTYDNQSVADDAVTQADVLKDAGATVFSVGIYTGANPDAAFRTTRQTYGNLQYWSTGIAAANGLMHFISSDYAAGEATSWSGLTTSNQNTAYKFENSKFLSANNSSQLSNVFTQIAEQTGGAAISMGVETVVQDQISSDFHLDLPEGTTNPATAIIAYAPKCTGKTGSTLLFEDINDNDTLTLTNGVVTGGGENRLPDGLITVLPDNKTLQLTNLNFDEMWCGVNNDHGTITPHGRKLVMMIPLEVNGDTWGDGIETNTAMSIILPDGDELHPMEFNLPIADVEGEVWTEVVINQPPTFNPNLDPIPLTTPEDLAWFISWVNGRAGYLDNPNVQPHRNANAKLMADVDMSAHNWVPIGMNSLNGDTNPYTGTFDGNGHVITGLKNNAGKKFMEGNTTWVFPGMFAKVGNGGVVKNVFVLDSDFRGKQREHYFIHHGIIADTLLAGGTIMNCEAAGRLTCNNADPSTAKELIFGGLVGLNQGTVHSCMAMAELTGYTLGGMIGENGKNDKNGTFANGFTNGIYHYLGESSGTYAKPVGGIAGINNSGSSISNCYVRFSRDMNTGLDNAETAGKFGRIVGDGSFTASSCYSPMYAIMNNDGTMGAEPGNVPMAGHGIQYSTTCAPSLMREAHSNDNMVSNAQDWPTWTSITTSAGIVPLLQGGTPLVDKLNAGKGDGASWKRTTAGGYATSPNGGNINGDYPILQINDFTCAASADGIRVDYTATLDESLDRHNTGNMNVGTNMPSTESWYKCQKTHTYPVSASQAIYGGAINLYANGSANKSTSTDAGTMVYIDENVSLLQGDNSNIDAYTCQTLKSFSEGWPGGHAEGDGERWHNISSSLQDSKFGWTYGNNNVIEHNWEPNPCDWFLETANDDEAIFPSDARSFAVADFYCFYEPQYHWINFRRNSVSHWHMDLIDNSISAAEPTNHAYIDYVNELGEHANETSFIPGKGYLMAISTEYFEDHYLAAEGNKHEQFIQNRGTLNNGPVNIPVTYTAANEWTDLAGYNLLGNPYQSYLDFDAFVRGNETLLANSNFANTYAVYDPEQDNYVQYMKSSSKGSRAADQYINMHQGFFIQLNGSGTATFNNTMRTNDGQPNFRGEQPAFPLINFIVTDSEGNTDLAIIEVNRDENDGARKLRVGNSTGRIFFRYDDEKLAIFFRDNAEGSQSLHFAAEENGNFTLSWDRANDNFSSLTLIDNITGVKTDMLTHDSYTFEGNTNDYTSRFKIVFGTINGEDEDEDMIGSENFAFFNDGNLIVNGEGHLDVVDVLGRVLYSTELNDSQNTVSLPYNAKGVCVLRITNGDNVKVQKIVVK